MFYKVKQKDITLPDQSTYHNQIKCLVKQMKLATHNLNTGEISK